MKSFAAVLLVTLLVIVAGCEITPHTSKDRPTDGPKADAEGFVSLFNGEDLTGWTPKFAGEELGVNYKDTFIVEDGVLKATYDNYDQFDNKFAHLFYETPFSHYIFRMEYRFVGEQVPGGAGWAWTNSGVMFHSQSPESMSKGQAFPVSVEAQTLGVPEGDERKRSTGNICTPGTHVVINGELVRTHCIRSSSDTFQGDQWVAFEIEVHGHGKVIHRINGEVVHEYEKCQLDPEDSDAAKLIEANGGNRELSGGYLALQAESHPVQFRNIRIKVLEE